jgi:mono/diheme cytochrome c family protein
LGVTPRRDTNVRAGLAFLPVIWMAMWRFALAAVSFLMGSAMVSAAVPPEAGAFIQAHCADCHDSETKKGGLDLSALPFDLNSAKTFDMWVKVHDRVRDGEMPPKKETRPKGTEVAAFMKTIGQPMVAADQAREAVEGRSVRRRLNRFEYENALRDLLQAPWLQISEMLPEDGESHRFNKDGQALSVSHVQMAAYLEAAEYALRELTATRVKQPPTLTKRYYAREQRSFIGKLKFSVFNHSPERSTFPMLDTQAQPGVIDGKVPVTVGARDPATREREAFGVVASTYEPIEIRFDGFVAPVSGRYRLKFSAYTFWAGPLDAKKWWTPDRNKISPGRRDEPVTIYSETQPRLLRRLGAFDVSPDPSVHELDVYLLAGETIRPDAARLFRSRPPAWHNPLAEKDGMPGVAFRWMEAQGPIYDQWPTPGHQLLFGDLPMQDPSHSADKVDVVSQNPHADAERLLRKFMAVAYRKPVPDTEIKRFLTVIDAALKAGDDFADAMTSGYSAVLCSPDFVCLEEKPGRLDDDALASRLSFFLWNSSPDPQLRKLAAGGQLHQPAILRAQVERLLNDPKSSRFTDAFLDYWLDLRKIVATAPDASLYPDYYLDDLLSESAEQETQLFFGELVRHDLPARNIVASDFTFLNERLATQYGIPDVAGVALRRVQLPKGSPRGGLMTQASVLKVTANGTTTSPVLRGAWVMERILGKPPPPPPPNVPAIEPDTRGATTIRAQLERHRSLATCAACHAKIDPAGFALESFDVMGGWRDHYRAMGNGQPVVGQGHNGQKFAFHLGQSVDCSSDLPDGRHFQNILELKKLLLADQRQLARNLVQQFVVYATGAPVRFGDRPQVEAILDRAARSEYGVRSLIHELVQSDLFQMK